MPRMSKPADESATLTTISVTPAEKNILHDFAHDGERLGEAMVRAVRIAKKSAT